MRLTSRALLTLTIGLALPAALGAQAARANFAGTYVLDVAQSDQGQMVPQKLTQKIAQTANQLVIERTQTNQMGESVATLKYALDGTPSVNEINIGGNAVSISTIVAWEGGAPVFNNTLNFNGNEIKQVDRWALDDGGKKLLVTRKFSMEGQENTIKLVLVKQP
jgi:hypothetical protein